MRVDAESVMLFFIFLGTMFGVIVATAVFAIWLRTKLVWTPLGRSLVAFGLANANGTIDDLEKGQRYIVTRNFVDYHGGHFDVGERLTFREKDYLPYHGGHTIFFEERTLYLQDEEQADILGEIWAYLEPERR